MAARTGPTCGADRRNSMGPCKQPAGWHTDHPGFGRCSWHGGNGPSGVKAAAREIVEQQAREELAKWDALPVGNSLAELRKLGGRILAWEHSCGRLLNKLNEDEIRYVGRLGGLQAEQLRAEVGMYQDALRQSAAVLASIARLDVDDRLARIEQQKADTLAAAFAVAIARASLPAKLERSVRSEFVKGLRVLRDQDDDEAMTGVVIPPRRALS